MSSVNFLSVKREILSRFAEDEIIPVPKDVLLELLDALEAMEGALRPYLGEETV